MKKLFWLSLMLGGLGIVLVSIPQNNPPIATSSTVAPSPEQEIQYNSYQLEQSVVHTLLVPASSRFSVTPALSEDLSTLESFAQKHQALAVLNGGFFDPRNHKTTSYVVQQGKLVADPTQNEGLINNPANASYLKQILDRAEFRRYQCGQTVRYDIVLHSEPTPSGCSLVNALGGGPRLLPNLTLVQEGFLESANGKVIRDALGSYKLNARSAVGITRDGSILLVMVAQKPEIPTASGMTLRALATFMNSKGVEKAMNLDGGSSSSFYYKGKTIYGRLDAKGNLIKRPVLSVLLIH
ncbi:MAG: phosphodiester glycosidase family protein [Cyanobacteriota bacterium]